MLREAAADLKHRRGGDHSSYNYLSSAVHAFSDMYVSNLAIFLSSSGQSPPKLPLYYPYITPILPLYYPYITPILLLYYPYITPILLLYYPYITPILRAWRKRSLPGNPPLEQPPQRWLLEQADLKTHVEGNVGLIWGNIGIT